MPGGKDVGEPGFEFRKPDGKRFGSLVVGGTVAGSIDEHASRVHCSWIASIARSAPHFDGLKLEHVNLRLRDGREQMPGAHPKKKGPPRQVPRTANHQLA